MAGKSLREITDELRSDNIARGWRPAEGGPGGNTFGDYVALLHTEIAEATEAYRDWGIADATERPPECTCAMSEATMVNCGQHGYDAPGDDWNPKPEGVGSELADVLIRTLDMADVFGLVPFDMDCELADVAPIPLRGFGFESFGDHMAWLHRVAAAISRDREAGLTRLLRALATVAERFEIDLTAEHERKTAYNRTRPYQHGGRTMAKARGDV